MKKVIEAIKQKKSIHYLLIIIVGMLIGIPFFWIQIRSTDDGFIHLIRLIGLDNAFENNIFPLVFPFFCKDWGYSMTAFYPPIVTYIPYILGSVAGTFTNGLKLFAVLTSVLSGIFMYNFVNEVTKKKPIALFAAILYMTFPYKLEEYYNRYAIGEFTAFIFLPIVFQGLYNLIHGDGKKHFYIAIGATGLMLTHTISTLYAAVFCVIYILFNAKQFFRKDVIIKCAINVVFILLMSAMFLLPMLEFKMSADYSIFEPQVMKTSNTILPDKTIEPWQFLKDKEDDPNGVSFIIGIPFVLTLFLGILVYRKIEKEQRDFYITSIILGVICLVMCTNLFPWRLMPNFLCTIQYPWRMLGFAFFFLLPVCATNIYYLAKSFKKTWAQNTVYIAMLAIIAVYTVIELGQYNETTQEGGPGGNPMSDVEYEGGLRENPSIHYFSVNRDYMPFEALQNQSGYLYQRGDNTVVLDGAAEIVQEEKEALHLEIAIKNATEGTVLELPFLFYPGYRVTVQNGESTDILETTESPYGMLAITIPEDIADGTITVDYTATTLDKASYIISAVAFVAFIGYVIWFKKTSNNVSREEKNI